MLATETIGKILLVVIVVAIVVVLLYIYVLQSPLSETVCRGLMTQWCVSCEMTKTAQGKYSGGQKMIDKLQKCIDEYKFVTISDKTKCDGAETACSGFVPQKSS
jgi:Ni/Fe-hydrogenase subunit HybB-like protein